VTSGFETTTKFLQRSPDRQQVVRVFLSSGADLNPQRELFRGMVDATNKQFRDWGSRSRSFVILVEDWEGHAASRTPGHVNKMFVDDATDSHAALVMFANDIGPGTQEEFQALLKMPEVQLSVVWMKESRQRGTARIKQVLELCRKGDRLLYEITGPPGSNGSVVALLKFIQAIVADLTKDETREEVLYELR
jgi:hypothetical protein